MYVREVPKDGLAVRDEIISKKKYRIYPLLNLSMRKESPTET